ncbi:hypothetical protein TVAG_421210 [Trichomonas vaginalis G3]|uniref:Uncharacterized protein n=1 Tax=Trichomonas vaginalis (strain ATCC PRA-98 / G3) TaxID=412133 RepID=A2EVU6_TRIV3|nr:hypothetical protein TVAGG3_0204420 [Trichomonas vaginalis G3]EAY03233.1 hypothetical protein TVAG_421210 [Trichomonas vaginalis G3]KAI5550831.1 hypothetical protein TVAGG3_0204420 [Trichomonas vaginalis G3]|eukprot:XP_001315456.1 hypothetical protein [Trichomonas vaginalis G3]
MNDEYRYFILDYPNLNKINSWRQRNSPTVEEEVANVTKAEGFERYVTDLPMSRWGGLVLNKINNYSLLNGNPGTVWWHYAVAMLCNEEGGYLSKGYPASKDDISKHEFITDRIRLWAKRSEVFPKLVITCLKPNNYYLIHILFSLFIPVCLES